MEREIVRRRRQQVLYDQKWRKFLRRSWPFCLIPFLDFVLSAGSMATGEVKPTSDFDVILGTRQGRIFTVRFFAVIIFGALGWRKKKMSHRESASDKICLNHFVTEKSYQLSPPYNSYWQMLYRNLVPVFGESGKINRFFETNRGWASAEKIYEDDLRHKHRKNFPVKKFLEFIFSGRLGDFLENSLKKIQVKKVEKSLKADPPGWKPRIKYGDDELEFHPDTRRIEEFLSKKIDG